MNWREHIHADPNILLGKPTIKGTRISVELILELLAAGWTEQQIYDSYPNLRNDTLPVIVLYLKECIQRN